MCVCVCVCITSSAGCMFLQLIMRFVLAYRLDVEPEVHIAQPSATCRFACVETISLIHESRFASFIPEQ